MTQPANATRALLPAPSPAEQRRRFRLEQDLRYLVPIAKRLAAKAGAAGINVGNLRRAADNAGLILASSAPRYRSVVYGQVMRRAGLVPTGRVVRTPRVLGGNRVDVWVSPAFVASSQRRRVA